MSDFNDALIRAYTSFDTSVDRMATSAAKRTEFRAILPEDFRAMEDDEILRRLLNLRKCGKLSRGQTQGV